MKKKMMKAIKELNAYIDNDRQELCDELSELKLSHKRMEKLLKQVSYFMRWLDFMPEQVCREGKVLDARILNELSYPYLRRNWGYTHKQEPGHYCDN